MIICPSRELAKQIKENVDGLCHALHLAGFPELRSCLAIGGVNVTEALSVIRRSVTREAGSGQVRSPEGVTEALSVIRRSVTREAASGQVRCQVTKG